MNEIPRRMRQPLTSLFSIVTSWRMTSVMRKSCTLFAAVCTALRARSSMVHC